MSTEAFNQLRTQEQLGYIVSLGLNVQADSVLALVLQVGFHREDSFLRIVMIRICGDSCHRAGTIRQFQPCVPRRAF